MPEAMTKLFDPMQSRNRFPEEEEDVRDDWRRGRCALVRRGASKGGKPLKTKPPTCDIDIAEASGGAD